MNGFPLQVELARGLAVRANLPLVVICRGAAKGCRRAEQAGCPDCYIFDAADARSTTEVLADMERGNA